MTEGAKRVFDLPSLKTDSLHLETWWLGIYFPFLGRPTPPKINMEHNNGGLEDDFPFQIGDF